METQTVYWQMPDGVLFEWDSAKAASNLRKHRISFPYATRVLLDPLRQERLDTREVYDEDRWIVLGRVDEWVLFVVYTLRGSNLRLISARKAHYNDYGIF